jgi:hypothetical protein
MNKIFYEAPRMNVVELKLKNSLMVISGGGPGKDDEEVGE